MNLTKWALIAIVVLTVTACKNKAKESATAEHRTVFFDKTGMDTTVSPGENFFLYANGKWVKNTKIPPSESGWGVFYVLRDSNESKIHHILNEAAAHDDTAGSVSQKVGDLFKSGMDTATIEKLGYEPVKPQLDRINALKDYKELIGYAAESYKHGDGYLFGFYVWTDDRNSTKNMAHFYQSELGLPNRDYYFKTDTASVKIRNAYVKYIAKLFALTGTDTATASKKAASVLTLETLIAKSHSTPVELRDPVKNYHKYAVSDFQKEVPDIDLADVFKRMDLKTDTILVGQPAYYKALDNLLKTQPLEVWKDKIVFDELNNSSTYLSKAFRDANFNFFDKMLAGRKVQRERWKLISENVDNGLGDLLGQLYVQQYFPPESKKRMLDLVNNLQNVYRERIQKLDWMSDATKKKALEKLDAFTKKIGYPDKWKTYDDVTISKDAYYRNQESISKHNYYVMIKKIGKPVDRSEWNMTPPTIDAYNNGTFNEIVFPAGILQFPFFDKDADDAINYGAIGLVIGHEMTHGFDDQGRQYDSKGNLKDWWTPEDAAKFKAKVQVVIDQYNKYTVLDNIHINGALTQGENLADIGGLSIAYQAFKNTPEGKSDTKIDGLTPDQRFFLAAAQVWRNKSTDEALRVSMSNNPHSPPMYRVNGPVSNMEAFYKAFNVKPGDKMYRPENERVKVW
jgi:putative endopeptidase